MTVKQEEGDSQCSIIEQADALDLSGILPGCLFLGWQHGSEKIDGDQAHCKYHSHADGWDLRKDRLGQNHCGSEDQV